MRQRRLCLSLLVSLACLLVAPWVVAAQPAHVQHPHASPVASIGNPNAKVTLIQFSDFQCPFCSRAYVTVEALRKRYGDDLRLVFVHQPLSFHANARPAAIAAMAAQQQGKFWEMYAKLFSNQTSLSTENYRIWAGEIGCDLKKFDRDNQDPNIAAQVDRQQAIANALEARGTPTFFINGTLLTGAQPLEMFEKAIDAEIRLADAALASGVTRDKLRETMTRKNSPAKADSIEQWIFQGGPVPPAPPAAKQRADEEDSTIWKVSLRGDEPEQGPADAPVTVVWFSDFQCPFCSKVSKTLEELRANNAKTLRLVHVNLPLSFHAHAHEAAVAAMCAHSQGKFWPYVDLLYANPQALEAFDLARYAVAAGADPLAWQICVEKALPESRIAQDGILAERVGARGTPTCYVNGRKVSGARQLADFQTVVDEELQRANKVLAKGTPHAQLYRALIEGGKEIEPAPPLAKEVHVFDAKNSPRLGPVGAKAQMTVFLDLECVFCAKLLPKLVVLQAEFASDLSIVFKQFPLSDACNPNLQRDMHPAACALAFWAHAAQQQGKFLAFVQQNYDQLAQSQQELTALQPDDEQGDAAPDPAHAQAAAQAVIARTIKEIAVKVGLDQVKAQAVVEGKAALLQIKADAAEAEKADLKGTPTVYLQGRLVQVELSSALLRDVVRKVLDGKL